MLKMEAEVDFNSLICSRKQRQIVRTIRFQSYI